MLSRQASLLQEVGTHMRARNSKKERLRHFVVRPKRRQIARALHTLEPHGLQHDVDHDPAAIEWLRYMRYTTYSY